MSDSPSTISDKDARIAALEALLAERDAALAEARAELLHRDLLIETMRVQLARLRRMQFGASSEKLNAEIAQLRAVLDDAHRRLSPKSVMAVAIAYGTKRWTALTRFLDDGRLEIDNNIAERSLRSIAIGRKNWL